MADLKKCPFCGGEAEIAFSGQTYMDSYWKGYIVARCIICKASVMGGFYRGEEITIPLEETIGGIRAKEFWNRRYTGRSKR